MALSTKGFTLGSGGGATLGALLPGLATLVKLATAPKPPSTPTPTGSLLGNTRAFTPALAPTRPAPALKLPVRIAREPGQTVTVGTPTRPAPTVTVPTRNGGGNDVSFTDSSTSGFSDIGGTPGGGALGGIPSTGQPFGGFASRYLPAEAYQAFDNPAVVLRPSLGELGYNFQSPVYESLRNLQGADPLVLYALMNQGSLGTANSPEEYINWLNAFYRQQVTPGGNAFNFNQALSNIFEQPSDASATSLLSQLLNQGDANTQVSTLYNLIGDAGRLGLNPLAQRAMQGVMRRLGDSYATAVAQGQVQNTPFYQFLLTQNPALFGRGR